MVPMIAPCIYGKWLPRQETLNMLMWIVMTVACPLAIWVAIDHRSTRLKRRAPGPRKWPTVTVLPLDAGSFVPVLSGGMGWDAGRLDDADGLQPRDVTILAQE
jgi:hypothetical protein